MEEHYETDLAHSARVLDDVDRALERLSQGTYGLCETCRTPILGADLEADPTRRLCEQHLPLRTDAGAGAVEEGVDVGFRAPAGSFSES